MAVPENIRKVPRPVNTIIEDAKPGTGNTARPGTGTEPESGTEETAQPESRDENSIGAAEESPQTGQPLRPWWFVVIGILVIVIGAGVFFVVKKKGDDN